MARCAFIERSRMGKVIYELNDGILLVSGCRGLRKFHSRIELHSLSPQPILLKVRLWRPLFILIFVGLALVSTAIYCARQTWAPPGALTIVAEFAAIYGAAILIAASRWVPQLEIIRFNDVVKRPAIDITRESAAADETDEFVQNLVSAIKCAKVQSDHTHPAPTPAS